MRKIIPSDLRAELQWLGAGGSRHRKLSELGHEIEVIAPRRGSFGFGQAVMSDGTGVRYRASEPRHNGAAIPEAPPVFSNDEREDYS